MVPHQSQSYVNNFGITKHRFGQLLQAAYMCACEKLVVVVQTPQGFVPNVALRFDYTQSGMGVSPTVSVYYTDRK